MNRYLAWLAWHRVRKNKKIYFLFAVQIFLTAVLIVVFSSISSAATQAYKKASEDVTSRVIQIQLPDQSLSEEDYQYIRDNYPDQLTASFVYRSNIQVWKNNVSIEEAIPIALYYVSDEFFSINYPNENSRKFSLQHTIFVPDEIVEKYNSYQWIGKEIKPTFFSTYEKESRVATLNDGQEYQVVPISQLSVGTTDSIYCTGDLFIERKAENTLPVQRCMILPLSAAKNRLESGSYSILSIDFKKDEKDTKILYELYTHFKEKYKASVTFDSSLQQMQTQVTGYKKLSQAAEWISFICVTIVLVGFVGLLFILAERRKRDTALAIACGAKPRQLYIQGSLEIFFVVQCASISGVIASIFLIRIIEKRISFFDLQINTLSVVLTILVSFLLSAALSIIPLVKMMKAKPVEILNSAR